MLMPSTLVKCQKHIMYVEYLGLYLYSCKLMFKFIIFCTIMYNN